MASYTYSKAKGLTARPLVNPEWGQGSAFWSNKDEADPNVWGNAEGLLTGDRKHAFRLQGNYDLPWELKLSGVMNFQSGRPYKIARQIVAPSSAKVRFISIPNLDENRLDSQTVLDLSLGKRFQLGDRFFLNLDLQFLNLLNDSAITYYASERFSDQVVNPGDELVPTDWLYPRMMRIRAKFSF